MTMRYRPNEDEPL
jgi:hypothetical protein